MSVTKERIRQIIADSSLNGAADAFVPLFGRQAGTKRRRYFIYQAFRPFQGKR